MPTPTVPAELREAVIDGVQNTHAHDPHLKGAVNIAAIESAVDKALPYLVSAYGVFGGAIPLPAKVFTDLFVRFIVDAQSAAHQHAG